MLAFGLYVAFRIHGQKVAEMPLVATRFKYRRKGMCRLLVDELEKVRFVNSLSLVLPRFINIMMYVRPSSY